MRQRSESLNVSTRRGLTEITAPVRPAVRAAGIVEGLCTVFVRHTSEQIAVRGGELMLGTWPGLYLWEHRRGSREREVVVHVLGE